MLARSVRVERGRLRLELRDGRLISRPLSWYPVIRTASPRIQRDVRVIFGGTGIRWRKLGYELGVEGIVLQRKPL